MNGREVSGQYSIEDMADLVAGQIKNALYGVAPVCTSTGLAGLLSRVNPTKGGTVCNRRLKLWQLASEVETTYRILRKQSISTRNVNVTFAELVSLRKCTRMFSRAHGNSVCSLCSCWRKDDAATPIPVLFCFVLFSPALFCSSIQLCTSLVRMSCP